MKIIALYGKMGTGKDTFYNIAKQNNSLKIKRVAFADKIKEIATESFGWDGEKNEKGRRLLQRLGTDCGREYNKDIWVNHLINKIDKIKKDGDTDLVVVTDCRFPNEIQTLKNVFGRDVSFVKITRKEKVVKVPERETRQEMLDRLIGKKRTDKSKCEDSPIVEATRETLQLRRESAQSTPDIRVGRSIPTRADFYTHEFYNQWLAQPGQEAQASQTEEVFRATYPTLEDGRIVQTQGVPVPSSHPVYQVSPDDHLIDERIMAEMGGTVDRDVVSRQKVKKHSSETSLDDYEDYDYHIVNYDGYVNEYEMKVCKLTNRIMKRK